MIDGVSASAEVRLLGARVGWLDYFEADERFRLEFDEGWLNDPDRHLLAQQFEDRIPGSIDSDGLHLWFQWLLPQGPLQAFLCRRNGLETYDQWALLLTLGRDLPGGVTVIPCQPRHSARRPQTPPPRPLRPPGQGLRPKHSLTGFQWKFSVRQRGARLVIPVEGQAGDWIAKFHDERHRDTPRLEHGVARWAQACGVTIPAVRLGHVDEFDELPEAVPTGDGAVFLSKRFDRDPMCHMEDFAQILGRANQQQGTAEELAKIIRVLCPPEDHAEYIRRLVFCVLCGNGDAHLKNWTLVFPDGRNARLSPAYDIIATIAFHQFRDDDLTLSIGGVFAFDEVKAESFDELAKALGWPLDQMRTFVSDFARTCREVWRSDGAFGLADGHVAAIERHMGKVLSG